MQLVTECWSQIVCSAAANEKAPERKRLCDGIALSRLRSVEW